MDRRHFLVTASAGAAQSWAQANDRVRIAIAGLGGRGNDLLREAVALDKVQVVALVDPDGNRAEKAAAEVVKRAGNRPRLESDLRRILDDKETDAVAIASTNHWHALLAIWAMQAGKDVYVEKPVSHNFLEGVRMVEAARKYKRVVQGGTQRRSFGRFRKAIQLIHHGAIGDIYQAKWMFPGARESIGFKQPQPAGMAELGRVARARAHAAIPRESSPL